MGGEGGSSLLPWSVAERVGETVGKEGEMGILACQQGPLLRKLSGGGEVGGRGPSPVTKVPCCESWRNRWKRGEKGDSSLRARSLTEEVVEGRVGGRRKGALACEQGPLPLGLVGKLGGGGSKRSCSQARTGEGFASQHNVLFLSFFTSKKQY